MEKTELPVSPILTFTEVRKYLHISRPTLNKLLRTGCLAYFRVGNKRLFRAAELERFILARESQEEK